MFCFTARHRISPYLDRQLAGPALARLEAHLERCSACAGELSRHGAVWDALAALGEAPPPPALGARVVAALPAATRQPAPRVSWWELQPAFAVALSLAVLLGLGAGLLLALELAPGGTGPGVGAPVAVSMGLEQTLVAEAFTSEGPVTHAWLALAGDAPGVGGGQ